MSRNRYSRQRQRTRKQIAKKVAATIDALACDLAGKYLSRATMGTPPRIWLIELPGVDGVNAAKKLKFDQLVATRAIALVEQRGFKPLVLLSSEKTGA